MGKESNHHPVLDDLLDAEHRFAVALEKFRNLTEATFEKLVAVVKELLLSVRERLAQLCDRRRTKGQDLL